MSRVVTQSVRNVTHSPARNRYQILCVSGDVAALFRCASVLLAFTVSLIAWQGFPSVWAQSQINNFHIQPRVEPMTPRDRGAISNLGATTRTQLIRANVDLALVPVVVTDPMNRVVTGLDSENVTVSEDKQMQEIKNLSCEDAPVSLSVILDVSGGMVTKIDRAREAMLQFLRTAERVLHDYLYRKATTCGRLHSTYE